MPTVTSTARPCGRSMRRSRNWTFPFWSIPPRACLKRSIAIPGLLAASVIENSRTFRRRSTYMVSIARLIFSGVLDRFPTLKFAFFEGGIGWVPWLMQTLDQHTPGEATISVAVKQFFDGQSRIKKVPGAYFEQFYIAAVSWEKYLSETIKGWPNHNVIIGSDFDHGDAVSTWPKTVEVLKAMPRLSEEDREKVLGGNAMR